MVFFFTLPVTSSLIGRLTKGKWWLNDFDALLCGADHIRRGLSPYDLAPMCEGLKPAAYVYAPQVGKALIPVIEAIGLDGARLAYAALLIPLILLMAWYSLGKRFDHVPLRLRVLGCGLLTGSSIASGNIGLFLHGVILLAALGLHKSRWPFLLAVVCASAIKPTLLTYLIVLIYQDKPIISRLGFSSLGAITGLAVVASIFATAGPLYDVWQARIAEIVVSEQAGMSFFAWAAAAGLGASSPFTLAGYVLFAVVMAVCGWFIAEHAGATRDERILLGLGMALLLNPRLMDYDLLILPAVMALVVSLSRTLGDKTLHWVSLSFVIVSFATLMLRMADIEGWSPDAFAVLAYCGLIIFSGLKLIKRHGPDTMQVFLKSLRRPSV
ncbi:hypothetical protein [Asticcacaulis endophyticus]|uniref:Uncharacterized protein n=1 Tax=Asticcacaulis endophyticus TaxID=1395890 RepID=A0A918UVB4_9CAUL|nr:hypothetical protein [Asticcacaulis endophyticus]GGZ36929.1 hypothetical protein GCM10011273_24080 [Asticcacaulis endophyticus]